MDTASVRPWTGAGVDDPPTAPLGSSAFHAEPTAHAAGAFVLPIDSVPGAGRADELPKAGQTAAGFHLHAELGRGTFGRVFLARQADLAGRPVAVKFGRELIGETHTLARLQHTNVVPVYSAHRYGPFQVVCMPFLGRTTLAGVLAAVRASGPSVPASARRVLTTLGGAAATRPAAGSSGSSRTDSAAHAAATPDTGVSPVYRGGAWDRLADRPYADAAAWVAAQLAHGLAHAHERDVLHRDIKPANVLVTDDGVPMLLDFNLADDAAGRRGNRPGAVGGTLPYMPPEQLAAYDGHPATVDARADLYSLGVVLFELLTGRRPFPDRPDGTPARVPLMMADRSGPPPSPRAINPHVRPSLDALVRKLLAPAPADRYQTAADLADELTRHLDRLPLRHAPNPSLAERAGNWAYRHPRLTSGGTLGAAAAVVLAVALVVGCGIVERARTLEARSALADHTRDLPTLQAALDDRGLGRTRLVEATAGVERSLKRYGLPADADASPDDWRRHALVRYLPAADRDRLGEEVGELYFLLARAAYQRAKMGDADERAAALAAAERWNRQAEAFGGPRLVRAAAEQKADLARMNGNAADADRLAADAAATPPGSARDRFLLGFWHYQRGHLRTALPELAAASAADPHDFSAWFVTGTTHLDLGQPDLAALAFTACVALRPDFAPAWRNRGLAFLRQNKPALAVPDLDAAIRLDPDAALPHYQRAGALAQLGRAKEADEGYTAALACADCPPRVHLYRAAVRDKLGDGEGAKADRAAADRTDPTDAVGWVARGENAEAADAALALTYIDKALEIDPLEVAALQMKAHLLGEKLNRPADAVRALDRALEQYPEHVPCLAGRAVLLARSGDRTAALADADAALRLSTQPSNLYQVACVYALTAKTTPADRFKAVELLTAALKGGFGKDYLATDPDLDPLRGTDEFKSLVKSVKGN